MGRDLIRAEIGQSGHRQNGAGLGSDDQAANARGSVLLHSLDKFGLEDVLHSGIEREGDVQTRPRRDVFFAEQHHFAPAMVILGLAPAHRAVEG